MGGEGSGDWNIRSPPGLTGEFRRPGHKWGETFYHSSSVRSSIRLYRTEICIFCPKSMNGTDAEQSLHFKKIILQSTHWLLSEEGFKILK